MVGEWPQTRAGASTTTCSQLSSWRCDRSGSQLPPRRRHPKVVEVPRVGRREQCEHVRKVIGPPDVASDERWCLLPDGSKNGLRGAKARLDLVEAVKDRLYATGGVRVEPVNDDLSVLERLGSAGVRGR